MSDSPSVRDDPYVAASPENLPFWQAAEEARLLGKTCQECSKVHWVPRSVCPFCGSSRLGWAPLSGRGAVHAWSTLRRADPPYTVAYVQLAEGPIMLTNLVDLGSQEPWIGMPVGVVFQRTEDGRSAPKFTVIEQETP